MSLEVIIVQGAGVEFSDLIRKYKEVPVDLYQLADAHEMSARGMSWVEFEEELEEELKEEIFFYYPLLSPILDPNNEQTFYSVEEMKLNIAAEILEFLVQKLKLEDITPLEIIAYVDASFDSSLNEIYYP